MSSAESLFKSFLIMIVCLIVSVSATNYILMPLELARTQIQAAGLADAPPEWSSAGTADNLLSLAYWLTYFLDFFAVGQFIWTCVRKQRYDIYGQPIED